MSLLRRGCVLVVVSVLAWAGLGRADESTVRRSADASIFSEATYLRDVGYLASDELEGRGTGQAGIDRAAEYIAEQFKAAGVQPAGDNGTYFQNFALKLKCRVGDQTRLAYAVKGRRTYRSAEVNQEFVPFPFSADGEFSGEVVFAGYGLVDDAHDYNDYEGIDVTDKVVLVLRRSPKFEQFGPRQMTFQAKAQRANARDAAAVLVVNPVDDEDGDKLYSMDAGGRGMGGPGLAPNSYGIPMLHINRATADALLEAGGLGNLATVQKKIEDDRKPASALLKGVRVKGYAQVEKVDSPVRNVVGMIPGTGPNKDEIIILGGHYDHLGIRNKGEPNFNPLKDISNGADDNASGTTGVMMLARAYAARPPNRSILVMAFTGEEMGLLGSMHFAKNPLVDLKKCVAMLNFDMIGRLKDNKLEVGGMRTGGFEEMVRDHAKSYNLTIADGGGGRGPSDHTSFYNKNIPVLFFFTGIHKQYHQPEDDTPLLNIEGAVRVTRLAADIVDSIDAASQRPTFTADTRGARVASQDEPEGGRPGALAGPGRPRGRRLGIIPDQDGKPGVIVAEVQEDMPAAKAGVKEGDRIVRIGDTKIGDVGDLVEAMGKVGADGKVTVVVLRGGKETRLDVQFAPMGATPAAPTARAERPSRPERPSGESGPARAVVRLARRMIEAAAMEADAGERGPAYRVDGKDFLIDLRVGKGGERGGGEWRMADSLDDCLRIAGEFVSKGGESWSVQAEVMVGESRGMRVRIRPAPDAKAGPSEKGARAESGGKANPHGDAKPAPKADPHVKADPHAKVDPHAKAGDGHGEGDDEANAKMPMVRLGILPTYAPGDGKGYEISGVVANGPAAKAGMKDSDRILRIGKSKITDVYSYMASLQDYKPGDVVEVEVLRDGKPLMLKIKCEGQKPAEAS